jgi:glycosyltransferase involved in cell wall biosynthesis
MRKNLKMLTYLNNNKIFKTKITAICQLTSMHHLEDERILHRMAWSIHKAGYVSAVAGPNGHHGLYKGINLIRMAEGKQKASLRARLKQAFFLSREIIFSDFDVFQIHDADLLPIAPMLKLYGKYVIYDVHDDYEANIMARLATKPILGRILSKLWWFFEFNISRLFDGVIVADRHLASKFERLNPVILGNFPRLDFTQATDTFAEKTFNIIYVGGVDRARGIDKVLDALELLPFKDIQFHVVGESRDKKLLERLKSNPRVICHGWVAWTELHKYYTRAHVGVALYQPLPSFLYYPGENSVKIIEYMAAGIPVICSDFPGLKIFVEEAGFGMTVPPDDPPAIAEIIQVLYKHPDLRNRMGQKGRRAYEAEYNWEKHESKLSALYERILKEKASTF